MVDRDYQIGMMKTAESILDAAEGRSLESIEQDLAGLGFAEIGADPAAVAMEQREQELYLEIDLDPGRKVHGYVLIPFEEKAQKQERFRW
ncbi:hypothetical protein [Methanofollis tationis]|uniref:Uncharacterized protein n=1 Tax=Methanofollis tationis TaxID=81417 RepID=A0A7K4HPT0_9EURY|nr:hypothetical protein [Methanofollis tationis]NVO67273.1 hypothetical protein [Methanofollis tationis]